MRKQIVYISPLQGAKVFAALFFVTTLPFVLFMLATFAAVPGPKPPFFIGFMLAMPFLYALFGFLLVLFGAWAYNAIAKRLGGFEFISTEVGGA